MTKTIVKFVKSTHLWLHLLITERLPIAGFVGQTVVEELGWKKNDRAKNVQLFSQPFAYR